MNSDRESLIRCALRFACILFGIWFAVGMLVVGFGLPSPFGAWADLAFIVFASVVLILHAALRLPSTVLMAVFLLFVLISGGVEAYGAATGLLFGSYDYSGNFGLLLFGLLPVAIPLAWWVVVWPLHLLVRSNWGGAARLFVVPFCTAGLAVWADLIIEPAATLVRGYWTWEGGGGYYGVPNSNFLWWFITSFVLSFLACLIVPRELFRGRALLIPVGILTATLATFLLLSAVNGKWFPTLLAVCFFAVVWGLYYRSVSRFSSRS